MTTLSSRKRAIIFGVSLILGGMSLTLLYAWSIHSSQEVRQTSDLEDEDQNEDEDENFEELPEAPAREEVLAILRKLTPYVAYCGHGHSGVLRIHLSIAGKTGAVTDASVIKQYSGTELAKCATTIVKQAQFPRFRKKTLSVVYPVTLPGSDGGDASLDAERRD